MTLTQVKTTSPRFAVTHCSQCGGSFGPGDHGYSHCTSHPGYARDRLMQAAPALLSALQQCVGALEELGETEATCDPLSAAYLALYNATF